MPMPSSITDLLFGGANSPLSSMMAALSGRSGSGMMMNDSSGMTGINMGSPVTAASASPLNPWAASIAALQGGGPFARTGANNGGAVNLPGMSGSGGAFGGGALDPRLLMMLMGGGGLAGMQQMMPGGVRSMAQPTSFANRFMLNR